LQQNLLEDVEMEGWPRVRREQWCVQTLVPLKQGQAVRVTARSGLVLTVRPLDEAAKGA